MSPAVVNEILFVVSAFPTVVVLLMAISKGELKFGDFGIRFLNPCLWYIMYPSMMYQIWFWGKFFNVI